MAGQSLPALEVFLAVARHRSFRRAAAERGVTASALSHAVAGLETALGVRLFNRTSRSVRITEAGEHLAARIGPALGDIGAAVEELALFRGEPAGTLRLSVPRNAAELVVKPVMARFVAAYPEVTLEVVTDDRLTDIVAAGFDAGIRAGPDLGLDMIRVPVGPPRRFAVVGSPAYLARRAPPRAPPDLAAHACIGRRFPGGRLYRWAFARDGETFELEVTGPLMLDDRSLIVAAAVDGAGLAHVHEALVAGQLASGALVRVLEDWCPQLPPFFLYHPSRRRIPPPLRAFIEMARAGGGAAPPRLRRRT